MLFVIKSKLSVLGKKKKHRSGCMEFVSFIVFLVYDLSFQAAVPGRRREVLLRELLRKGKGTGPAGFEALQRSRNPGGHLQPLPGRTSLV